MRSTRHENRRRHHRWEYPNMCVCVCVCKCIHICPSLIDTLNSTPKAGYVLRMYYASSY